MESGHAWFWSRSRQELWHKGATSGHYLNVVMVWYDCDVDAVLVQAKPDGPTCHTGERSCFYRRLTMEDVAE
jgi:phosphoribosyl-AMP cyclohydrolase